MDSYKQFTEKHRFVCGDDFGAMMSCVYEAWRWGNRGFTVELAVDAADNYQLFCVEHYVPYDEERALKVIRSIRDKISWKAFQMVYHCAMSEFPEKLEVIYRFLRVGFAVGSGVTACLTEEPVMRITEIAGRVASESHKFREFVRFTHMGEGILCSVIEPKSNLLTLIAPHFADRMVSENFMIIDQKRKAAVIHPADGEWYLRPLEKEEFRQFMEYDRDGEEYARLWRVFFDHIAVLQRKNPRCQMNFLPKWYRTNMTEFTEKEY